MIRLIHILRDNELCGALESDLHRFHQADLSWLYTTPRKLTLRKIAVWIRHLPEDSALARRGFGERKYSLRDTLLAENINTGRIGNWQYVATKSEKEIDPPDLITLEE